MSDSSPPNPPVDPEEGHEAPVCVWETSDPAVLPVIESLLQAAEIPFFVQGEESLGMLPMGGIGGTHSTLRKGIVARILVEPARAEEARTLIDATTEVSDEAE